MTWALLLAKWVEFAKAAAAIPEGSANGESWRASIEHVISLQAVACALGEAGLLDRDERALAVDRASVIITNSARALSAAWASTPMPEAVLELLDDARRARDTAAVLSLHIIVTEARVSAPDPWALGARLVETGFSGDLLAAPVDTVLFAGSPVAVAIPCPNGEHCAMMESCYASLASPESQPMPPRQSYRVLDEDSGDATHDLVAAMLTDLPVGAPLLVPIISAGRLTQVPSESADRARLERQAAAIAQRRILPVLDASTHSERVSLETM